MNSEEKKIPYVIVGTDGKVEHGMVSAYDLKLKMCEAANSNNFGISRREWNDSERNKVVAENDKIVLYNGLFSVVGLPIMPNVVDVTVLNNRVVVVSFADSTETKAVLSEDDTFSIEQGIAICMMKKLIQTVFGNNCASVYNKLVEIGMNVYDNKLADIEKKKKAEADAEAIANYLWNNGHRKSNGWVNTIERPPDSNGYYLCYCRTSKVGSQENWEVKKLYWENNVWLLHKNSFTVFDTVSHWAELPEAPTEGE